MKMRTVKKLSANLTFALGGFGIASVCFFVADAISKYSSDPAVGCIAVLPIMIIGISGLILSTQEFTGEV